MTINRRTLRYLTIGAMLACTSTATAQSTASGQTLEGAWNATVVFDQQGLPSCAPAGGVFTAVSPGSGTVIVESVLRIGRRRIRLLGSHGKESICSNIHREFLRSRWNSGFDV